MPHGLSPSERQLTPLARILAVVVFPVPLDVYKRQMLDIHSDEAAMIGDRMDTDIVAGIETGLDTVLVLSGVTSRADIALLPYRPRLVLPGVGDIVNCTK